MKKVKTKEGEDYQVEEFDIYRPICLANIWGMENVLADRCISVVLEKSSNKKITRLMELFDIDEQIIATKTLLLDFSVVLCSVVTLGNMYTEWNKYITTNYNTSYHNNYTKLHSNTLLHNNELLYKKIIDSEIDGRNLEITFPLFVIASFVGEEVLEKVLHDIKEIVEERKVEDIYNNKDVAIIDFISQEIPKAEYFSINDLARRFKEFIGETEDWVNAKTVGRSLERTKLVLKKKRMSSGIYIMLDYNKAVEKMRMFR